MVRPGSRDITSIEHIQEVRETSSRTQEVALWKVWTAIVTTQVNISPEVFRPNVELIPHEDAALRQAREDPLVASYQFAPFRAKRFLKL